MMVWFKKICRYQDLSRILSFIHDEKADDEMDLKKEAVVLQEDKPAETELPAEETREDAKEEEEEEKRDEEKEVPSETTPLTDVETK